MARVRPASGGGEGRAAAEVLYMFARTNENVTTHDICVTRFQFDFTTSCLTQF